MLFDEERGSSQFADVVTGNPASLAITLTKCFENQTWQFFQTFHSKFTGTFASMQ